MACDALGSELWAILSWSCDLMWDPDRKNEHMVTTATRFHRLGMRRMHLQEIGAAVKEAVMGHLGPPCPECGRNSWPEKDAAAWGWLWTKIEASLEPIMASLELEQISLVRHSWESVQVARTSLELGDLFYNYLAEDSPQLIHLFQRPRKMQAYVFMQSVEMVIRFGEDPEDFFQELKPLVIRHIKYGVKPG
eukprot:CAMPEP_0206252638 /NCGR_PEP_ID=MMETSP0047_2-20121206/22715_1 /ASSEMBLY_ACC=CAM_ASM_000192 /TAXON_ID=195065 /ORGANISM="Chroomonas mesostigmatica_cf, Strain CCMP1168" /LENGTH=191 /DNA_ID=CAMNT_0053678773 /DNA_START=34 /DNA_END=606 /DNA_ORIENTATION=+